MENINDLISRSFGFISNSSPEDLEFSIKNNVDLSEIIKIHHQKELFLARTLKSLYKDELKKISPPFILENIKENRPELYEVIVRDEESITWFVRNIIKIKELIFEK